MSNKKINPVLLHIGGPIVLSVLSLLLTSLIIQWFGRLLDPSFHLLANKGLGKFTFSFLVLVQLFLFLSVTLTKNFEQFLRTCIFFYRDRHWFSTYLKWFCGAFAAHAFLLVCLYFSGYVLYNPIWSLLTPARVMQIFFAFGVTFLLAWSEELIFRGMLYSYFKQHLSPLHSIFVTSLIFMFVHDIPNPLNLITRHWKLGLGLFLLGVLLNLLFELTGKIYVGMGVHAGLVSVKVLLRRLPLIAFLPKEALPVLIRSDLRSSLLVHACFLAIIIFLIKKHHRKLSTIKHLDA
jgi:membrane protease YdiL (CAAX protease family)